MLTLNETIKLITDVADGHSQIAARGVGDLAEWNPSERTYPLLWVVPVDSDTEESRLNRTFRIGCFDRVIVGEEGQDNEGHEQEVLSDMEMVLLDFVAYFVQQDQEDFFTARIANLTPATEQMDDRLAGYFVDLTISQDWTFNKCQIPATVGTSVDVDGLTLYDFCDDSVFNRLTTAQKDCLTTALCGACDDATVQNNATPTWSEDIASGDTYTLPQGKMQDSDGSTVLANYIPAADGFMFTAGVCADIPSIAIKVYSDVGLTIPITECDRGDTVYININPSDITPTAYRFVTNPSSGVINFTEQAGATLTYVAGDYGTVDIYGIATDGTGAPSNPAVLELTVNADADAVAFIDAHNTATGQSMASAQQDAVFNLVGALKGTGTPNGEDVWTCLSGSRVYIYCPVSDASANADGYQINLIDPSANGVLNNFTTGDISTFGVTGGSGKYLAMGAAPDDFDQDSIAVHAYSRTSSASAILMEIGAVSSTVWNSPNGITLWPRWSTGIGMNANSSNALVAGAYTDGQGLLTVQRDNASTIEYYQDGAQIATSTRASLAPISTEIYGHAANTSSGVNFEGSNQLALLAVTCALTADELEDFTFAVDQYQTEVITGGRNV